MYTLYLGDCLEYMRTMDAGSVDAVITDPPYGCGLEYSTYKDTRDNIAALVPAFMNECLRISNRVIVTPGVGNIYLYPPPSWILSWVNMAGVGSSVWGFSCWQPILVYGKDPFLENGMGRRPDTYQQRGNEVADVNHPCPKPDNVMRWIIDRTTPKSTTIFDPFMGSGTTGVACMQLGRNFIGCEIDPAYFAIAEKRIAQAAAQPLLFTDAPKQPEAEQLTMGAL